ncbi:MAG: sigma 54-interacting transcriptional regulator [Nitrospirales bacterium]
MTHSPTSDDSDLPAQNQLFSQDQDPVTNVEEADQLQQTLHHLGERVKELTALHTTARLFQEDRSIEALLEQFVQLLPPSWQYPEITAARICFDPFTIATSNFTITPWVQRAEFMCQGKVSGLIEVVYLEEKPQAAEGPFLAEERNLINSLAEMLRIHLDGKRSTEELRKLSKVYMDATDPIIIEDLHGKIMAVNPEAERVYEWTARELIGQSTMKLIPPEWRTLAQELRSQCQQGQLVRNVSAFRQSKSGIVTPVLVSLSLLTEEGHQPTGLVSFTRDISELKKAEAALRKAHDNLEDRVQIRTAELSKANHALQQEIGQRKEAEQRLEKVIGELQRSHDDIQAIMNQLSIGMVLINRDGNIIFLSHGMKQITPRPPERFLGRRWEELFEDPENISLLKSRIDDPHHSRESIKVRMPPISGGRICWVKVDVREDPRDSHQKILYLYDTSEVEDLRRLLGETGKFQDLIGKSPEMQIVFRQIQELARVDSTVLIEGETGTGKELVARAIHRSSHRQDGPFIGVNCAGLTESLVGSQLFGHKRGAFTGAVMDQEGLFEAAEGGTLFLDEIGDIPLSIQTSLLRVLQEREITRLGESKIRKINVRVIAATHHNLEKDVKAEQFRADLFYRIRVGRVPLPPLRERREDIPLLSSAFLGLCRATTGRPVEMISHQAIRLLMGYPWPGNVRELQHAIEFAVIRCGGNTLQAYDFPPEILTQQDIPIHTKGKNAPVPQQDVQIIDALEKTGGNRSAAAKLLGISRVTLYRRLHRLGIQ